VRNVIVNRLSSGWTLRRIRNRFRQRYANLNLYSGEFGSFEEARAAIPSRAGTVGYDNTELAGWYRDRLDAVQPEDYPVLFWLSRLLPEARQVFDFGGHVGLHYFSWRKLLGPPPALRWKVSEVGAVVEAGRSLARERGAEQQLAFTTEPRDADGADVFIASGSVQYLEPGFLWRLLAGLQRRPRHVFLNKTPVHDDRDFVTIQDAVGSFHPYSVVARTTLQAELERLGYEAVDGWKNPGLDCLVYLRPELHVPKYSGGYWRLRGQS